MAVDFAWVRLEVEFKLSHYFLRPPINMYGDFPADPKPDVGNFLARAADFP